MSGAEFVPLVTILANLAKDHGREIADGIFVIGKGVGKAAFKTLSKPKRSNSFDSINPVHLVASLTTAHVSVGQALPAYHSKDREVTKRWFMNNVDSVLKTDIARGAMLLLGLIMCLDMSDYPQCKVMLPFLYEEFKLTDALKFQLMLTVLRIALKSQIQTQLDAKIRYYISMIVTCMEVDLGSAIYSDLLQDERLNVDEDLTQDALKQKIFSKSLDDLRRSRLTLVRLLRTHDYFAFVLDTVKGSRWARAETGAYADGCVAIKDAMKIKLNTTDIMASYNSEFLLKDWFKITNDELYTLGLIIDTTFKHFKNDSDLKQPTHLVAVMKGVGQGKVCDFIVKELETTTEQRLMSLDYKIQTLINNNNEHRDTLTRLDKRIKSIDSDLNKLAEEDLKLEQKIAEGADSLVDLRTSIGANHSQLVSLFHQQALLQPGSSVVVQKTSPERSLLVVVTVVTISLFTLLGHVALRGRS